jgi:alpha-beta hydrolase superfamily lysophospholipase
MKIKEIKIWVLTILIVLIVSGLAIVWKIGDEFCTPAHRIIGLPPYSLNARMIDFKSYSGKLLKGWFIKGSREDGGIVLVHGLKGSRLDLVDHAKFFKEAGYSVLLFDLQAHGESEGSAISLGYLESMDVRAAVDFMHKLIPNQRVGILGNSLGGAACILGKSKLNVDALAIEEVFATIEEALTNRVIKKEPSIVRFCIPIILLQLYPRFGITAKDLHPIDQISGINTPLLMITGSNDPYTPIEESKRLFSKANEPKELWIVEGAKTSEFVSL